MVNTQSNNPPRFKDLFATICNNHQLRLRTQKSYWYWARYLIRHHRIKSAKELENDPLRLFTDFLSSLAQKDYSQATQAQAWNALVFLFTKVVGIELGEIKDVVRATRQERFIDVPDTDQARRIVESIQGDVGIALRLIFGTAMRLSDCLRLRVKDVDLNRKEIAIQESKGGKSRLVPIPSSLIGHLEQLIKTRTDRHERDISDGFGWVHLPHHLDAKYPGEDHSLEWQYLFASDRISKDPRTGNLGRHHLKDVTLQKAMLRARTRLRFKRRYSVHSLRHSTAQFWERNGVSHTDIQQLLGHSNLTTTQRYLRSGKCGTPKVPSPI